MDSRLRDSFRRNPEDLEIRDELLRHLLRRGDLYGVAEMFQCSHEDVPTEALWSLLDGLWLLGNIRYQNRLARVLVHLYEAHVAPPDPHDGTRVAEYVRGLRWLYEVALATGDTMLGVRVLALHPLSKTGNHLWNFLDEQWGDHRLQPARTVCVLMCSALTRSFSPPPQPEDVVEAACRWCVAWGIGSRPSSRWGEHRFHAVTRPGLQNVVQNRKLFATTKSGGVMPRWKAFPLPKLVSHDPVSTPEFPDFSFQLYRRYGGFPRTVFPVVRSVYGTSERVNELVSVQPLTSPAGLVFFVDHQLHPGTPDREDEDAIID